MYYKVKSGNSIVDTAKSPLNCCKYVSRSKCVMTCSEEDEPSGIVSERLGKFYQVDGWALFPASVHAGTVELIEATEAEYDTETQRLDEGKAEIAELAEKTNLNAQSISGLEDAVLELAEIIGG